MSEIQPIWTKNPVAANVRAEMARRGVSANRLPGLVGESQSYWARRMTGRTPFDVNDLIALAQLLEVHPGVFFEGTTNAPQVEPAGRQPVRRQGLEPRTRYVDATASEDGIARILPADSNPDAADSGFEADVIQMPTWRNQPGVIREAVAR